MSSKAEQYPFKDGYMTLRQASEKYGITISKLRCRVRAGKTLEEAVALGSKKQPTGGNNLNKGTDEWRRLSRTRNRFGVPVSEIQI